jgi:hypothetical protein
VGWGAGPVAWAGSGGENRRAPLAGSTTDGAGVRRVSSREPSEGVVAILLVGLLVVVWAVVLVPGAVRRWREGRTADAVSAFHRVHRSLHRSQVRLGCPQPALHRLRTGRTAVLVRRAPETSSGRVVLVRPDAAEGSGSRGGGTRPPHRVPTAPGRGAGPSEGEVVRRRRDVAIGLGSSVVLTALLGMLPPLHPLLVLAVVVLAALVGYVVLLVRLRSAEAGRSAARARRDERARRPVGSTPAARAPAGPALGEGHGEASAADESPVLARVAAR